MSIFIHQDMVWNGTSSMTGLGPKAKLTTCGAGRMIIDPEAERGNAHVVPSAARRQGGGAMNFYFGRSRNHDF